jgi:hypothetical protein
MTVGALLKSRYHFEKAGISRKEPRVTLRDLWYKERHSRANMALSWLPDGLAFGGGLSSIRGIPTAEPIFQDYF